MRGHVYATQNGQFTGAGPFAEVQQWLRTRRTQPDGETTGKHDEYRVVRCTLLEHGVTGLDLDLLANREQVPESIRIDIPEQRQIAVFRGVVVPLLRNVVRRALHHRAFP